ncbi:unnamed protein product [Parnassius apollo]|uniref:ATP-dependent DNA helicase n=1 Tax=Parnassius apollo TaxID=110799 RepID=A0A8S3WF76_PARAO|nr:unnamed protein product [Parnassius apollo]
MDIQFILDPFACAVYIVDYINKADRGMSRLLREALDEAKKGNKSVKDSLRIVSNVFLNSSEISAQEAIYVLTGLPLSRASEAAMYINTSLPQERVHILKSYLDLQSLEPDSSDIFQKGIIDYYSKRPLSLENISLSHFVAYYTYSKKTHSASSIETLNDSSQAINYSQAVEEVEAEGNWIPLQDNLGYIRKRTKTRVIRFRRYSYIDDPDNFYREQIMLYIPWRSEEEELLNPNINIKDIFDEYKERIKAESKQFNKLGDAEMFETLLTEIRNVELINEEEDLQGRGVNVDVFEGFEFETQTVDIAEELIPGGNPGPQLCGDPSTFIAQPPVLSHDDFLILTRKLNDAQRDTLFHIYQHFSITSPHPLYLFISGGAGVGKSILIKAIYQCLTLLFNREAGSNPDELKILLTAFTGKAAFGIGGQTIHSALGLPVSQAGNILPELSPSVANTLATKLAKLRLIVIDEISMLGSRTFHQINRRLQQIFHSSTFFSGISVIVVGDFRQLPPVGDNWVFQANSRNPLAEIAGTPLWDLFVLTELKEIMRQRDDVAFATALNNMASGCMSPEDVNLIEGRCFSKSSLPDTCKGAVHLFSSNREVDGHNSKILSNMTTEGAISRAVDRVSGEANPAMKEKALNTVAKLPTSQTYGLPNAITLKITAKYMMTVNINTSDGLVNGTTGVLTAIDFAVNPTTGERRPLRIWICFDDVNIGKLKRIQSSTSLTRYQTRLKNNWTPIEPVTYTVKRYKSSNLQVRRSQFPVVPAEAVTIHKSQGSTLEKVVVHLKPNILRSMLYVACSRATSSKGLFIVTETFRPPRPPSEHDSVVTEMRKLKLNPLIPIYRFLREPRSSCQIMFHNVQSLRKHLQDVVTDPQTMACDIYLAVETWSCLQDLFNMNNFEEIVRTNGPKQYSANPGFGVSAMIKHNLEYSNPRSYSEISGTEHCEAVSFEVNNVKIVALYRSCKCPNSVAVGFISNLLSHNSSCIIFGDFNEDYLSNSNTAVFKLLNDAGYHSMLQPLPTTRGGTQIDNIFSNFPCVVGIYNSFLVITVLCGPVFSVP